MRPLFGAVGGVGALKPRPQLLALPRGLEMIKVFEQASGRLVP